MDGVRISIALEDEHAPGRRACGDCQLCCRLLPVQSVKKAAGKRCWHQRHHKGCAVYHRLMSVAPECKLWSCRWLTNDDTADLRRPDRSHYVIDMMPDFVTLREDGGATRRLEVVQVWVDPGYPNAHEDLALRAWLERRAEEGKVGLIRFGNERAITVFPPAMSSDRQWHVVVNGMVAETQHSFAQIASAIAHG